jgi:HD-GYP domain-containing protein (c-di-GMP phosphodiesterase class II)
MMTEHQKQQDIAGYKLLRSIGRLVQIARLYDSNNKLLADAVKIFIQAVKELGKDDSHVSIQISDGRFYLQEKKLSIRRDNAKLFNQMLQFLETRKVHGFHFQSELTDIGFEEIITFARLLDQSAKTEDPFGWLSIQLEKNGLTWIAITQEQDSQRPDKDLALSAIMQPGDLQQKKEKGRKTYSHVLNSVKEVAQKLSSQKNVGLRKSVRVVQNMVDIMVEDEPVFLALSTIRMYDDYTFFHSLNVAILAMCLGKRIGLTRKNLERLGLCGLFHDLGKIEVPKQILNKRGKLTESEFAEIKKHSMNSVLLILKLKAERGRKVNILIPPFEHHMSYDHSGYPNIGSERPVSLFGRILSIADVYDAITSPRIYRPSSMTPDQALGYMSEKAGKQFDPVLMKVFINMLGVYPVGTLLELDTGEIGVAMQCADRADRTRPKVQLLISDGHDNYLKGQIVDLMERDPQNGNYSRNIKKSLHPSSIGIQPAKFLI